MGGPSGMGGASSTSGYSTPDGTSTASRFQEVTGRVSEAASGAWQQTRQGAGTAREKTEFFLRENPVPTVIGALALGLAIGLAIRYASERERETEVKTPLGDLNLGMLSLPFLWPFFKSVQRRVEDGSEAVKEGVDRLKHVDVNQYVKPLRKKWRNWTK